MLAHPNINDIEGLVLYLDAIEQHLDDSILHASLRDPVLQWTTECLADQDFEEKAYAVMKEWLALDRWNRRYRKMGRQKHFQWKHGRLTCQIVMSFCSQRRIPPPARSLVLG